MGHRKTMAMLNSQRVYIQLLGSTCNKCHPWLWKSGAPVQSNQSLYILCIYILGGSRTKLSFKQVDVMSKTNDLRLFTFLDLFWSKSLQQTITNTTQIHSSSGYWNHPHSFRHFYPHNGAHACRPKFGLAAIPGDPQGRVSWGPWSWNHPATRPGKHTKNNGKCL